MRSIGAQPFVRCIGAWLARALVLTLVLRALVPLGFMPAFSASDGFKLVVCSSSGAHRVLVNEDGKAPPAGPKSHADQPCGYAGLGHLALAPPEADLSFRLIDRMPDAIVLSQPGLSPVLAGPTLGSRAPPFFS